jgi:hypothetical protein
MSPCDCNASFNQDWVVSMMKNVFFFFLLPCSGLEQEAEAGQDVLALMKEAMLELEAAIPTSHGQAGQLFGLLQVAGGQSSEKVYVPKPAITVSEIRLLLRTSNFQVN